MKQKMEPITNTRTQFETNRWMNNKNRFLFHTYAKLLLQLYNQVYSCLGGHFFWHGQREWCLLNFSSMPLRCTLAELPFDSLVTTNQSLDVFLFFFESFVKKQFPYLENFIELKILRAIILCIISCPNILMLLYGDLKFTFSVVNKKKLSKIKAPAFMSVIINKYQLN